MTRFFAHAPKIFQRLNNSRAEKLLPIAVHRGACSERLPGHKEPSGKRQAIAGCTFAELGKQSWDVRRESRTDLGEKVSALEFQRFSPVVVRFLGHDRSF